MADYTVADVYAAARRAGFSAAESVTATAISLAEDSSRMLHATNHNSDGSTDFGPWQINSVHLTPQFVSTYGNVFNLQDNARMAYAVYQSQGWHAWSTYNSGAYRAHLKAANMAKKKNAGVSFGSGLVGAITNPWGEINAAVNGGKVPSGFHPFAGLDAIGNLANHLTDSGLWKRIGIGVLAAFLVLIGILFMLESNKSVQHLTETAAMA